MDAGKFNRAVRRGALDCCLATCLLVVPAIAPTLAAPEPQHLQLHQHQVLASLGGQANPADLAARTVSRLTHRS